MFIVSKSKFKEVVVDSLCMQWGRQVLLRSIDLKYEFNIAEMKDLLKESIFLSWETYNFNCKQSLHL